jgi:hypothetical protein
MAARHLRRSDVVAFQRFDDSFARYGASIDVYKHTIGLTKGNSRIGKAVWLRAPSRGSSDT